MSSLRDIRKRIRSVKSTEKITKAMKMVAASKLRRAQDEVKKSRAYSKKLSGVIGNLAFRLRQQGEESHPLLETRDSIKKVELLVLTSDRGLCGAFNTNILRKAASALSQMDQAHEIVRVSTLGRKGFDALQLSGRDIRKNYEGLVEKGDYKDALKISEEVSKHFMDHEVDTVWLVYNEFKSVMSQEVILKQMLPVLPAEIGNDGDASDYIYEPTKRELLDMLVPKHFATLLHQAFLESRASEYGARMTAMDSATRNAKKMTGELTLKYNRARQASITNELMEIIGGAEALA